MTASWSSLPSHRAVEGPTRVSDARNTVKRGVVSKKARVKKRCEIQGGGQEMAACDGRLMAKILMKIQVNLVNFIKGKHITQGNMTCRSLAS